MSKRLKKDILSISGTAMVGAGLGIGVAALGGNTAGINAATSHLGTMGTISGIGGVMRSIETIGKHKKKY